jgi:hypothetical protein
MIMKYVFLRCEIHAYVIIVQHVFGFFIQIFLCRHVVWEPNHTQEQETQIKSHKHIACAFTILLRIEQ